MYDDFSRTRLVRLSWKASTTAEFSEAALIETVLALSEEAHRPKLRQALPTVWQSLDHYVDMALGLPATGLDGEAIDAINATIGAGLSQRDKKNSLHEYTLRPQDFPALLFLAFIAARLATPYMGGGPHRKVRDQFWYAPELAIIVMRCLPPKLDLLVVEHALRKILETPAGEQDLIGTAIGLPASWPEPPLAEGIMGLIEEEDADDAKA